MAAGRDENEVRRIIDALRADGEAGPALGPTLGRLPARERPNPEVAEVIRVIQANQVPAVGTVLTGQRTCPAGVTFVSGESLPPFPRLEYVPVPDRADEVADAAKRWAIGIAISYAHVRVKLDQQSEELALGAAIAYYVLRRGSPGSTDPYDTDDETVRAAAENWLAGQGHGTLPMGVGEVTQVEGGWQTEVQTANNLFFLMTLMAGHGQTMTRERIEKFRKAANSPLARVTCNPAPPPPRHEGHVDGDDRRRRGG